MLIGLWLGLAALAACGMLWFVLDQRYQRQLQASKRQLRQDLQTEFQLQRQAQAERARELEAQAAELATQAVALERERSAWQQSQQAEQVRLSALTPEDAKAQVLAQWESRLTSELEQQVTDYAQQVETHKALLAQQILSQAVQRAAASHARENLVTRVMLPSQAWRGPVIGKDGRNIEALQMATGAGFSLDPEAPQVWVSAFDPLRREVARRTLVALLESGRIYPDQIELEAQRQQQAVQAELPSLGAAAALEVGVQDLHPDLLQALGQLHYRNSYGQNGLLHAQEVARLAAALAEALGADVALARRAGLLHDLGKVLLNEQAPETHTELGADLARRCGETPEVIHAMAAHHFEVSPRTLEAVLVQVADTLSAARPGARSSQVARQVTRLQALEQLALGFAGVRQAWVLRAGQEIRVMVDPDEISEAAAHKLSFELARRIEAEVAGAGQVKVSVFREMKYTDFTH